MDKMSLLESPRLYGKLCIRMADTPGATMLREINEIYVFEGNDITFTVENEEIIFKILLVKNDVIED